ncbi:PTS fructose transporter subunit IIA [Sebaldella sp. S0638]|uniref:PTS sugar transporter subunit IIA n=1 Tax=Sebaldella sp. S0638 TaxID=2957809 RepID=UPI0020A16088|nr:PTS fructose transporter subunit IIA [Sebaldella sp. S0638]
MKHVILVSHGTFAPGLHNALNMLAGAKKEELKSTSLLDGMGIDIFENNFITLVKDITENDKIVLLADIIGGSPMTTALNVLTEKGLIKNTVAFGGMNLSMGLTAVLEDGNDTEALKKAILGEALESVAEFKFDFSDEEEEI